MNLNFDSVIKRFPFSISLSLFFLLATSIQIRTSYNSTRHKSTVLEDDPDALTLLSVVSIGNNNICVYGTVFRMACGVCGGNAGIKSLSFVYVHLRTLYPNVRNWKNTYWFFISVCTWDVYTDFQHATIHRMPFECDFFFFSFFFLFCFSSFPF